MRVLLMILLMATLGFQAHTQEKVNTEINQIIRKHGLEQSQVMEIASWMTDVYGPRLTASPMLDRATQWAVQTLQGWGMKNVHTEDWGPFGRGWELKHFAMHATAPNYFPIIAYPKAWSPSTKGTISGEVIYLDAASEADLAKYKGKLKGKFVFMDTARVVSEWFDAPAKRLGNDELLRLANAPEPTVNRFRNFQSNIGFANALWKFLYDEQPLAIIDRNYKGDLGTVFVSGARTPEGRAWDEGRQVIPQATVSIEHYNRIFRLMKKGIPVTLSMNLEAMYANPDKDMERNIIAEIPGTDLKDEVVMFGAHFDSWHSGTGATDNAAGSSVMMEAARILLETIKETGIQPRRTLRLALWTGEEQGLYGSRGYVEQHFAEMENRSVKALKPAQQKISAYYNLDNGTGRIRGVYMQGNAAVAPIFRAWLDAFRDLDATTLTMSNTGGTDHLSFDGVGIPGFQFIQDPVAYSTRTHHSNMDNWDHLVAEDLRQAATIVASFVWHTSQRDEMLPRKPMEIETSAATGSR
ncbi:MAG TPA: M20/M25/M40 family metallo-hydrolase [Saprospiraceae bacterium]|nr:M20/M25/M40 family metallo-hydrolase [Saprospiraceae bacterium]HMP24072.1 M20/M25/M40 family metallo-hydrolase [Saprospiraceae bacterium]